jgi:hypothetical protein
MSVYAYVNKALIMSNDYEFVKQKILTDNSLTKKEKTKATRILNEAYDRYKIISNSGTKRICESCNKECLATLYCEYCVRNYLKVKFSNWTSGNNNIDILIKKCQMEAFAPFKIIEWIPYEKLQNIKFLTKGGYSEIYKAVWINGVYNEWNTKKQKLKRFGRQKVIILKTLGNVESENQRWFEEVCNKIVFKEVIIKQYLC